MEEIKTETMLQQFPAISLAEMSAVRLMNRIDTKYTVRPDQLLQLLQTLTADYFVQEIDGKRISLYHTVYLDTADLAMYTAHQCGRRTRRKIRVRTYMDTQTTFLEIKNKNNKGRTRKTRIVLPETAGYLSEEASRFIEQEGCYAPHQLMPHLQNRFYRITLVNRLKTERLTIDINLKFNNLTTGQQASCRRLVIIELKQDGNCASFVKQQLSEMHVLPVGISKYCLGTILINPPIRTNLFKKKLIHLNKITNNTYGFAI